MAGNAQKTHYARTINRFAEQKVLDAIQTLGKAIPCHVIEVSGSIVTVRFDIQTAALPKITLPDVTMPMFGPEYIRYPTQVGDLGITMSADYYIGGVSGLGGGVADFTLRANLSTLVFFPIANADWHPAEDPDALTLYGVHRAAWIAIHKSGAITALGQFGLDGSLSTTGNLSAGNGATGTFQSADGQTVVVVDGIVVSIS